MRKNSPRKWLHAILDLLPILIIPIFAININQKSVEPISIEVQEKVSIDFNQKLNININERTEYGLTYKCVDNVLTVNGTANDTYYINLVSLQPTNFLIANHKYCIKFQRYNHEETEIYKNVYWVFSSPYSQGFDDRIIECTGNIYIFLRLGIQNVTYDNASFTFNIFDLTQMFGEGKEPTLQEFDLIFENKVYPYVESQKMLVNKPSPTTYNDTDVGSQFVYTLYKPINDYFNFNNLFNMNDVWNWIQLNLFQGTAPLPVFMVWNIIVYEFFMDLIFLLYSVFMFIIDFSTGMIDSFLYKSRKGV